ncbi:MAG: hypothetical protein ACRDZ9_10080 [Acidimicrobiales bacterium]
MPSRQYPVELVIQTATAVLDGRLDPREAVTILATQVPQARSAGGPLGREDPERAAAYASIIRGIGRALRDRLGQSGQRAHLQAVLDDLAAVLGSLPRR